MMIEPVCENCKSSRDDVQPIQLRVTGKATQYESKIRKWCCHCRKRNNGKYRKGT